MPVLSALTPSTAQLLILLRSISFAPKAHVHITSNGLRFSADDTRAMQGLAFLDKSLFTHYHLDTSQNTPTDHPNEQSENDEADDDELPVFQISLPALLETLQIFSSLDTAERSVRDTSTFGNANGTGLNAAFDNRVLGMPGTCRITYEGTGYPLNVQLSEGNVSTDCELTAYEPELVDDIPFDRESVRMKVIMRAATLVDAIAELGSLNPERLLIIADPSSAPFFRLSAEGALGSAEVDFEKDSPILETFQVQRRESHEYKFSMVRSAVKAMAGAAKVSMRWDGQGVLSLQFMVEVEASKVSFVDFRFVPFVGEGSDDGVDDE
ncbi:MAG: hypothetical protein Q9162_002931 [Coniocarpon cinnabarinum]